MLQLILFPPLLFSQHLSRRLGSRRRRSRRRSCRHHLRFHCRIRCRSDRRPSRRRRSRCRCCFCRRRRRCFRLRFSRQSCRRHSEFSKPQTLFTPPHSPPIFPPSFSLPGGCRRSCFCRLFSCRSRHCRSRPRSACRRLRSFGRFFRCRSSADPSAAVAADIAARRRSRCHRRRNPRRSRRRPRRCFCHRRSAAAAAAAADVAAVVVSPDSCWRENLTPPLPCHKPTQRQSHLPPPSSIHRASLPRVPLPLRAAGAEQPFHLTPSHAHYPLLTRPKSQCSPAG